MRSKQVLVLQPNQNDLGWDVEFGNSENVLGRDLSLQHSCGSFSKHSSAWEFPQISKSRGNFFCRGCRNVHGSPSPFSLISPKLMEHSADGFRGFRIV